ncbi:MAG: hypothetical protein U0Z70_14725 [Thermomicrobiales bacterium]
MSRPAAEILETFEQFCHDLGNPLMVISGHAQLLHRAVERLPDLPEAERVALLAGLLAVAQDVRAMAVRMDAWYEALASAAAGDDDPEAGRGEPESRASVGEIAGNS